jgi:hypothetical protein
MGTRVNPLYTGFAARTTPTRPAGGGDLVGGSTAADGRGLTHAGFDSQLMPAPRFVSRCDARIIERMGVAT